MPLKSTDMVLTETRAKDSVSVDDGDGIMSLARHGIEVLTTVMSVSLYQITVLYWIVCSILIFVLGTVALCGLGKSETVVGLVCFGKFRNGYSFKKWLQVIEVPKKLFWVFYFVACISTVFAFTHVIIYRPRFTGGIFILCGLALYFTHVSRRLYECLCVSIFSDSKMNIVHFLLGITFYPFCICSQLLSFAQRSKVEMNMPVTLIVYTVLALAMFVVQLQQHRCFVNLAALRLHNGSAASKSHTIPYGGLFEYCSSPHYTLEITLYLLFVLFYQFSLPIFLCSLFVAVNQTIAAFLNHRWYQRNFHHYPIKRTALIPYIL